MPPKQYAQAQPLSLRVRRAVRELRFRVGETRQQFADRLSIGIATVNRYELTSSPHGRMLVKLARIAEENRLPVLAQIFDRALNEELGLPPRTDLPAGRPRLTRQNPVRPPCRLEEVAQRYSELKRSITGRGFQITAIQLHVFSSEGREYVEDLALPGK